MCVCGCVCAVFERTDVKKCVFPVKLMRRREMFFMKPPRFILDPPPCCCWLLCCVLFSLLFPVFFCLFL